MSKKNKMIAILWVLAAILSVPFHVQGMVTMYNKLGYYGLVLAISFTGFIYGCFCYNISHYWNR